MQKVGLTIFAFLIRYVTVVFIVLFCVVLFLALGLADRIASGMLFHPRKFVYDLSSETFDEVRFLNSRNQTIHGVFFPYHSINPHGMPVGTILHAHGNAENVAQLLDWGNQMRADFRCNILIFDYAGYGKSEGKPTAAGILDDGQAAFNFLVGQKNILADQIILSGFSLGGSVAVDLASKHPVKGLIVESSFTSLGDMGREIVPFLPAEYFLWEKLNSIDKIGNVRCPVFVSHGQADRVIPFSQGQRLFDRANEPKTFFIPPAGWDDHSAPHSAEHIQALRQFINSL